MQKKGPVAARAGGRRVVAKRPADLKKKKTPATTANTKKKNKKKGKDDDDNDPQKAHIKLVFKTIAIGSAAGVILMAIAGITMITLGYKLPNPKSVAHDVVTAALARVTVTSTAVALVVIAIFGLAVHLYRKHRAKQAREKRLQQKRQLEAARKALQHERKRQKIEMRKRRRELEQQDLVNKGKLIAELDELEKQREEEFEVEQRKLEEELRREAELERQIAAETRAHQYRVQALQQLQREEAMRREALRKGKVVPGYDPSLDTYSEESSDNDSAGVSDEEEEEEEEDNRAEVEVELNPAPRGFQLNMATKLWWDIATLRARVVSLRLLCNRCALPFDASLSGIYEADCSLAKRCSKCKTIQRVRFRPQLIHESNLCIGYADVDDCQVQDITSVQFDSTCMNCSSSATFKSPAVRGRRVEVPCFKCHQKMALEIESLSFLHFTADGVQQRPPKPGALQMAGKAGAAKRKKPLLKQGHVVQAGESLPNQGACKHFRKSYKWFRFPCCGLCFPCPVCHEQTNCDGAVDGTTASHVVCGKCSHEQGAGSKECSSCGFRLTQKNATGHWAGGTGTRDTAKLSSKDRKKNQGVSRSGVKKTQSKKSQRVGQRGKVSREAKKKGGK